MAVEAVQAGGAHRGLSSPNLNDYTNVGRCEGLVVSLESEESDWERSHALESMSNKSDEAFNYRTTQWTKFELEVNETQIVLSGAQLSNFIIWLVAVRFSPNNTLGWDCLRS